ncbi:uncharacterized protein LOC115819286 [Chanos chanos]|uniref:Uncharacterized protein LOC115819286 n=1 Tax=Chanos chanos TaxID=29144 RepID=A0A6J2W395_CHACN|nr:uncharacterized protein LOC115819286 [Chanos chanos]
MENEEEEDNIFTTWMGEYEGEGGAEEQEEQEEEETVRKSSVDIPKSSRSLATRRASLPCPAQLHAMQLTRLHVGTMAPSPAHVKHRADSDLRTQSRFHHSSVDEQGSHTKSGILGRRPSTIPTIPEVMEPLERKMRFRSRNVMSLSDADSICLICHDDLRKGSGGVRELHCTHSFHSECIEEWLWTKQSCPTCRVHVAMPEPLYWTSTRVKVP